LKDSRMQMLRFMLIGLFSTGLYFVLLIIFEPLIPSIMVLAAVCYIISMAFNFLAQALFTFQVQRLSGQQLTRYSIMHGAALLLNSTMMSGLVNILDFKLLIAQVFVTSIITVMTFALSKTWVYK